MTLESLLALFEKAPLVASAQASEGSSLDDPDTLLKLAQASLQGGVKALRLQGVDNIRHIHPRVGVPTIGLIKRHYDDSSVYITPTMQEVDALVETGVEAIGLDATFRRRPGGASLADLLARVKAAGRLAMADCDTFASALEAQKLGFDFVGTTLAGYTDERPMTQGPDLELLRQCVQGLKFPVIAEGRYSERWHVQAALRIGAKAVVMGAALNDTPVLTRRYLSAAQKVEGPIAAFDIGGTWLRYGLFDEQWNLLESEKVALPEYPTLRHAWIQERVRAAKAVRAGISTGGVVDPRSGIVTQAKDIIPHHVGSGFGDPVLGIPTIALNDGLATAWGHACLPQYAGTRVATLALGTGVGFGIVDRGRILMSRSGEPPHLNDMPFEDGRTIEEALGGASFGDSVGEAEKAMAHRAGRLAVETIRRLFHPDAIVLSGGVGLSDWLDLGPDIVRSPFGADAGLYGAAAMALWRPEGI